MVKIISVCSGKGGVGKTVVASNLAIALKKYNNKVALLDFNFTTPHLSLYFDLFSHPLTLNKFLRNEIDLESAIYEHDSGLNIVPTSLDVADIVDIDINNLREKIREVFWGYDFVVLDAAPGLGKEALLSLKVCDEIIFVANPQIPSLVDVAKTVDVLRSLEKRPNIKGVIINRVKNKNYEANLDEIINFLEMPVLGVIPEDKNILELENKKSVLTIHKKHSKSSREFYKIAADLSEKIYQYSLLDRFKSLLSRN